MIMLQKKLAFFGKKFRFELLVGVLLLPACQTVDQTKHQSVVDDFQAAPVTKLAELPEDFTIHSKDWMMVSQNDSVDATANVKRLAGNLYTLTFTVAPEVWDGTMGVGSYSVYDLGMFMTCVSVFVSDRSDGKFVKWSEQDGKIKPISSIYLLTLKSAKEPLISEDKGDYNQAVADIRWDNNALMENAMMQPVCLQYFPNYPK